MPKDQKHNFTCTNRRRDKNSKSQLKLQRGTRPQTNIENINKHRQEQTPTGTINDYKHATVRDFKQQTDV